MQSPSLTNDARAQIDVVNNPHPLWQHSASPFLTFSICYFFVREYLVSVLLPSGPAWQSGF